MISQQQRQEPEQATMRSESTDPGSRGWGLVKTWDFGLLWWGQVTSQVGEGLNKVALLWFVYELTGSPLMIAMVGLLQTIPPLMFGPIIGVYLDRLQKKKVMIWVDLIRTVFTFLIPALYGLGLLRIEGLFVLIFLTSMVSTVLVRRWCRQFPCWSDDPNSSQPMHSSRAQTTSASCSGRPSAGS